MTTLAKIQRHASVASHQYASLLRNHATRLVAIVIIVVAYGLTRLPQLSSAERAELVGRFDFTRIALPEVAGETYRSVRAVHPSLAHISGWISSVGASVALNDLDGDGLSNDVCYVDTRTDQVIVAPVPGTSERYAPFTLNLPHSRVASLDVVAVKEDYEPATVAPMGCLPGDMNEDGRMDILVYYWGRTPIAFLQRTPTEADRLLGAERYLAQEIYPQMERWYTNAATFADLDGDGHADLIFGNYFQDGARILDATASGREEMQHSMSRAYNAGHNRILLWTEGGSGVKFSEVTGVLPEKVARGWTLALGAADLDGDLLPELYFANDFGPDRLLHNRSEPGQLRFELLEGEKTFTTPNSKMVGRDSFKGMGTDFGDLNGDGLLDIYVSNIAAEYALEESHFVYVSTGQLERIEEGIAPYVDLSEPLGLSRSGWGWDSRLGDFDNDGVLEAVQATGFVKGEVNRWPELHELAMGNDELLSDTRSWMPIQPGDDLSGDDHNPFFVRAADGRYYDLAHELGLDTPQVTRGIATADVDGDGDLDFAVANQWDSSYLYRNDCPNCAAFLGLHLRFAAAHETTVQSGHPTNIASRPAIGAEAIVHLPDGRRLVAQVDGGNGHSGARSPELLFGLGQLSTDTELTVELRWRERDQLHQETWQLTPGWHTVLLAEEGS